MVQVHNHNKKTATPSPSWKQQEKESAIQSPFKLKVVDYDASFDFEDDYSVSPFSLCLLLCLNIVAKCFCKKDITLPYFLLKYTKNFLRESNLLKLGVSCTPLNMEIQYVHLFTRHNT